MCERAGGRRAVTRLREALLGALPDPPTTRSELERDFLDFCSRHGLPAPSTNVWVAGQEVDAAWLDRRVVVELDSYDFHRSRAAFERDRVRSADLEVAGFRPIRITSRRMTREPQALRAHLLSLLAVRGAPRPIV